MNWSKWERDNLSLNLYIQPHSSKDEWSGLHGDSLKVRIKALPIDGRANKHLIKFLAKEFGVKISDCTLLKGENGREKRIKISCPQKFPVLPDGLKFIE